MKKVMLAMMFLIGHFAGVSYVMGADIFNVATGAHDFCT